MKDEIMVSIICNTYNHEKYIRDALESFLMQKTEFPFEILIHDDASTDCTPQIIKEYEKKYPNIIKPIYQTENQYSKKISIGRTYQFPRVKGKYSAICEGDDFWTDPLKLQKQYILLEKYPEIDMCAHSSSNINANTKELIKYNILHNKLCIVSPERIIKLGGGAVATASLFFRSSLLHNLPEYRKIQCIDYSLQIQGSLRGGMIFLPDNMCCYRVASDSSWCETMKKNKNRNIEHRKTRIKMLMQLDIDTEKKYHNLLRMLATKEKLKILAIKLGYKN